MIHEISRSSFLKYSLSGVAGLMLSPAAGANRLQDKPAPIDLALVREFVGVAHGKIDRVKEMLESNHLLLHVSYDWGGGDYESAIEAAGHVGNREIADYLLSKGARYNIYLACMLGHLDIVRQVLVTNPSLINSKGPHGFTMLHHAQRGGATAIPVVRFLEEMGAKETKIDFYARS